MIFYISALSEKSEKARLEQLLIIGILSTIWVKSCNLVSGLFLYNLIHSIVNISRNSEKIFDTDYDRRRLQLILTVYNSHGAVPPPKSVRFSLNLCLRVLLHTHIKTWDSGFRPIQ
jgi:hypothetical protein